MPMQGLRTARNEEEYTGFILLEKAGNEKRRLAPAFVVVLDPRLRGDDAVARASACQLRHLTLTSFTSNETATFGGNGLRGFAP